MRLTLPLGGALVVQVEQVLGVVGLEHGNSSRSVVLAVIDSSREGGAPAWGRCLISGPGVPYVRVLGE
ncbi:hypothetical protein Adi01nite_29130 [Amorphoplanes digitatis]|nr:hypothetical protein Adi01nite_29130 [Actinoplanes digitatis]